MTTAAKEASKFMDDIETNESFKFRDYQRQKIIELYTQLSGGQKIGYLNGTFSSGKTIISLVVAILLKKPITFLVNTYEAIDSVIEDLEKIGQRKKFSIGIPLGRSHIAQEYCKNACSNCDKKAMGRLNTNDRKRLTVDKRNLKGLIINTSYVQSHYPHICPYVLLKNWTKKEYFDIIITHNSFMTCNSKIKPKKKRTLIVDEAHKPTKALTIQLSRYQLGDCGLHLENPETQTELQTLYSVIKKVHETHANGFKSEAEQYAYENRISGLKRFISMVLETVQMDVREWETKALNAEYEVSQECPVAHDGLTKAKLSQAINLYELNTVKNLENLKLSFACSKPLKEMMKTLEADLAYAGLQPQETALVKKLFDIFSNNPIFTVHCPIATDNKKGYIEINAVSYDGIIQKIYNDYERILEISATPNHYPTSQELKTGKTIETPLSSNIVIEADEFRDKRECILIPKDKQEITATLNHFRTKYNMLGIVKSKKDIEIAKSMYGGLHIGSIHSKSDIGCDMHIDDAIKNSKSSKGNLFWTYSNSSLSMSINKLEFCDGCFVVNCFQRDPATEENKELYLKTQMGDLCQLINRIFRLEDGKMRKRFIIMYDEKIFNALKLYYSNSMVFREASSVQEAISLVDTFAEPLALTPKKEVVTHTQMVKTYLVQRLGKDKKYWYSQATVSLPDVLADGTIISVTLSYEKPDLNRPDS